MHTDEMKCPFRVDENGEFPPCYGENCMAYYEYEFPCFETTDNTSRQKLVKQSVCRRLVSAGTYSLGTYTACSPTLLSY